MIFRRCEEFPPHRSLRKQVRLEKITYIELKAVLWMTIRGSIIIWPPGYEFGSENAELRIRFRILTIYQRFEEISEIFLIFYNF
jgi:hypothetical protein